MHAGIVNVLHQLGKLLHSPADSCHKLLPRWVNNIHFTHVSSNILFLSLLVILTHYSSSLSFSKAKKPHLPILLR